VQKSHDDASNVAPPGWIGAPKPIISSLKTHEVHILSEGTVENQFHRLNSVFVGSMQFKSSFVQKFSL
jgi:hypothetical protein